MSHHGWCISEHVLGGRGRDNDHVNVLPLETRALQGALRSTYGEVADTLGTIENVPRPDTRPRRDPILLQRRRQSWREDSGRIEYVRGASKSWEGKDWRSEL